MNKDITFKIVVDTAMLILFVFLFSPKGTGLLWHEILGIILFVLFALHNISNYRWYGALFKGKYNITRLAWSFLNAALFTAFVALIFSGVIISRRLFSSLELGGGFTAHKIHVFTANWCLVLAAIHFGLHLDRIKAVLGKFSRFWGIALHIVFFALAVYGLVVCFERDIWSKLFLQATFPGKRGGASLLMIAGNYFAVFCLFVLLGSMLKSVLARECKNV